MIRGFYDAIDTLLAIQKGVEAARGADYFGLSTTSGGSFPAVNLFKKGEDTVLTAEIPGVKKEDIKLEIKDNLFKVSGERKTDYPDECSAHRLERKNKQFSRTIKLPNKVELSQVSANYEDGILTVVLPQAEADKPQMIQIN